MSQPAHAGARQFGKVPYEAIASGRVGAAGPFAAAVYLVLCAHARDGHCFLTMPTIARESGMSERAASGAVKTLSAATLIFVKRGIGRGHANEYRIAGIAAAENTISKNIISENGISRRRQSGLRAPAFMNPAPPQQSITYSEQTAGRRGSARSGSAVDAAERSRLKFDGDLLRNGEPAVNSPAAVAAIRLASPFGQHKLNGHAPELAGGDAPRCAAPDFAGCAQVEGLPA